ncbi:Protein BPS1, chloroplastic, partial [Cucurbita argyrosperma subsp. sororia]
MNNIIKVSVPSFSHTPLSRSTDIPGNSQSPFFNHLIFFSSFLVRFGAGCLGFGCCYLLVHQFVDLSLSYFKSSIHLELELPVTDWNEKWIDVYLDISVKLLDVCNVVSSELSHLNQSNLMLRCITHNLDSADSKRLTRARASLDEWRLNISTTNSRIKNCCVILDSLVESLDLPKVKNSAKGKVLMHALYGVKVQTVFVCSVFASTFLGSPKLFDLKIAATYSWGQTFSSLQSDVNSEIRSIYSHGKFTPLKELEAIDQCVGNLHQMIPENPEVQEVQPLKNVISELGGKAEKLSEGVHLLSKEVDNFFQIVLAGRDALLSNLRKG